MSTLFSNRRRLLNAGLSLVIPLAMLAGSDATAHAEVVVGAYYPVGSHASTLAEGYLRGRADLRRSDGHYNLYTSQAMINREVARGRYIENRAKARQAYFQLQRMARADRAQRIAAVRRARESRKSLASNASRTQRPSADQLDPISGRIAWPTSLDVPRFSAFRNRLDSQFAERSADNSGVGSQNFRDIWSVTKQMKHRLRVHLREYDTTSYIAAKKFIDSLAYEARFAANTEGHTVELSYRPQIDGRQLLAANT